MTRRHPREGIRDRWVYSVGPADVGTACKLLLMYLTATHRVTERGAVAFKRDVVADELGIHPQQVSKGIREAIDAGLLDKRGGGYRGRTAEYEVLIPPRGDAA